MIGVIAGSAVVGCEHGATAERATATAMKGTEEEEDVMVVTRVRTVATTVATVATCMSTMHGVLRNCGS